MTAGPVLVTGGAGFIGSHLCDALLGRGVPVIALDDLSTGSRANVAHLAEDPGFRLVEGSVLDEDAVARAVERAETVVHLAAAVGVRRVVEEPLEALRTNIRGAEIVLEAADRCRRKVMMASTSEIYGKGENVPFKEEDDRLLGSPLRLRWSYSASKAIDEILAYAYFRSRQLPTVIVRLFNTVGPRQTGTYGMVVPRFVEAALANEPLQVYGTGDQTRSFCHVRDVVDAVIGLLEHPDAVGKVFNVGSGHEISINDLAARVIEITGSRSPIEHLSYADVYEDTLFEDLPRRVPDTTRIASLTGWRARLGLDQILRDVAESLGLAPAVGHDAAA